MTKLNKVHNDGENISYISLGGNFHVTNVMPDMKNVKNGKIIKTSIPCSGGYARVGEHEITINANGTVRDNFGVVDHPYEKYPEVMAIYDELTK